MVSERQALVLEAVRDYTQEHGYAPSVRDVQMLTGTTSTSVAQYSIDRLIEAGLLTRAPGGISRSLLITDAGYEALRALDAARTVAS